MFKLIALIGLIAYAGAQSSFSFGGLGGFGGGSEGGFGGGGEGGFGGYEGHHQELSHHNFGHHYVVDYQTHPHYQFKYAVHDPKHHDVHEQFEERDGDKVRGQYSLNEADGTIRVVKYEADKHNGFNAIVERKGHATHPQHYKTYHHESHHGHF